MNPYLTRYKLALEGWPRQPDAARIEASLLAHMKQIGATQQTVQHWKTPAAMAARAAMAAMDARAAMDAMDAMDAMAAMDAHLINWWGWDATYYAAHAVGAHELADGRVLDQYLPLIEAIESGLWVFVFLEETVIWIPQPHVALNETRQLHNESGPAFEVDGWREYFIGGVFVDEQIVMRPETLTIAQIEGERNQEAKRVRIERFGWGRYLDESGAEIVDSRVNDRDKRRETLYGLGDGSRRIRLTDPSTNRQYALGVPREVATCQQAQDWLNFGLDRRIVHRS